MASITKYAVKGSKKGYKWRVQYRDSTGTGRTKQGFTTKDEAANWAAKNTVDLATGEWTNPLLGKTTISELGAKWKNTQIANKPSTQHNAKDIWDRVVEPLWGNRQVSTIKPSDVQAWVSGMDHSASWVRQCHGVLAQAIDVAVGDKMIRVNPARGIRLPRKVKTVKVYYTMPQLTLLATEAEEAGKYPEIIYTLGTVGLRWGEMAPLRPMDLDPLRGRIGIDRNVVKVGSDMVFGTPKGHERRRVAVPAFVMGMLMDRAEGVGPEDLLWPNRYGEPMKSPGHNTWFDGAMKRAMAEDESMKRVSPHGLRHVAAGLLVQAGANVKAVQHQLGHKDAAETLNTYAELFDDGLDDVADTMNSMWLPDGCRGNVVDSSA